MTWDKSEPAASTDFLVAVGKIRNNNAAVEVVLTSARLLNGTYIADLFPIYNKTPMLFYMSAPPVGWTEVSDVGDSLIAVKGGTTYTTGGDVAGSWTIPEHTLTEAEIPAHTHTYNFPEYRVIGRSRGGSQIIIAVASRNTSSTGGGSGHSDGNTWRPAGRVVLLATKN